MISSFEGAGGRRLHFQVVEAQPSRHLLVYLHGIESHGGITSKASNIVEILRQVDSPYAGCNLDISNFPENPYPQIEACIPYATHVHVRDFYGERKEPLDLDRVFQMFARGGYKGYMSAEYEGQEDAMTGVPKLLSKIKDLCKKYSTA